MDYNIINQDHQPLCWLYQSESPVNFNLYKKDNHIWLVHQNPLLFVSFANPRAHNLAIFDFDNDDYQPLQTRFNKNNLRPMLNKLNEIHNNNTKQFETCYELKSEKIELDDREKAQELAKQIPGTEIKAISTDDYDNLKKQNLIPKMLNPVNLFLIDGNQYSKYGFKLNEYQTNKYEEDDGLRDTYIQIECILQMPLMYKNDFNVDIDNLYDRLNKLSQIGHYINIGYNKETKLFSHNHFFFGGKKFPELEEDNSKTTKQESHNPFTATVKSVKQLINLTN